MGNPKNLAYSSGFNYQKINQQDTISANVAAGIFNPTVIATIPATADFDTWRVFVRFGGKIQELSYFDNIGINASLYSYKSGSNLIISCDSSGAARSLTFYYRIYLHDS